MENLKNYKWFSIMVEDDSCSKTSSEQRTCFKYSETSSE
jgi:hypothetical protein